MNSDDVSYMKNVKKTDTAGQAAAGYQKKKRYNFKTQKECTFCGTKHPSGDLAQRMDVNNANGVTAQLNGDGGATDVNISDGYGQSAQRTMDVNDIECKDAQVNGDTGANDVNTGDGGVPDVNTGDGGATDVNTGDVYGDLAQRIDVNNYNGMTTQLNGDGGALVVNIGDGDHIQTLMDVCGKDEAGQLIGDGGALDVNIGDGDAVQVDEVDRVQLDDTDIAREEEIEDVEDDNSMDDNGNVQINKGIPKPGNAIYERKNETQVKLTQRNQEKKYQRKNTSMQNVSADGNVEKKFQIKAEEKFTNSSGGCISKLSLA